MAHDEIERKTIQFYESENWPAFFDVFNTLCGDIRLDIRQVPRHILESPDSKLKILLYCAKILKNHIKLSSQNTFPAQSEVILKSHSEAQNPSPPQATLEISCKYYDKNHKHLCLSVKTSEELFPRFLQELKNQNLSIIHPCQIFNVWLNEDNPTTEIFFQNIVRQTLSEVRNSYLVIHKNNITLLDYIDEKGIRYRSGVLKMGSILGGEHGGLPLNYSDASKIISLATETTHACLSFSCIDWFIRRSILIPEAYVDPNTHTYHLFLLDTESPENLLKFSGLMNAISAMDPSESTQDLKSMYFCEPYSKSCEQVISDQARGNFGPIEEWITYHYMEIFSGRPDVENIDLLFRMLQAVSQENPYYRSAQEKLMDLNVLCGGNGENLFSYAYRAQHAAALPLFRDLCGLPLDVKEYSSVLEILLYAASVVKPTILAHPRLGSTYIDQQPRDCGWSGLFWRRYRVPRQEPTPVRELSLQG